MSLLRRVFRGHDSHVEPPACSPTQAARPRLGGLCASTAVSETLFAVVDLETTGLSARGQDRIVEVSIELFNARGQTFESLTSLVQPGRSVGAYWIHGISDDDVSEAPSFEVLAERIHGLLRGTVVVGHNVAFDISFLRAAFERAGMQLPVDAFVADTMRLAPCFYPQLGVEYDRRLPTCCDVMGIGSGTNHRAAGDAAATRAVFDRCLQLGEKRGWRTLSDFGIESLRTVWRPGAAARRLQSSSPCWNERVEVGLPDEPSPLRSVIQTIPAEFEAASSADAVTEYRTLLERVVEDRLVTDEEVAVLRQAALATRLTRQALIDVHCEMLADQASCSQSGDGDLERLAWALDLTDQDVRAAIRRAPDQPGKSRATADDVRGRSEGKVVSFTGALNGEIHGLPITRLQAAALAEASGFTFSPNVTKRVDILVVANPDSQSAKGLKARATGIQVVAEQVFWRRLGGIDAARARLS
jgi:DNA polymerase III subunit epsilon